MESLGQRNGCIAEMDKFERLGLYHEVPEDSLTTWDAVKGYASEVVRLIWTLKRKRDENGCVTEHRCRCVFDGAHEKQINSAKGADKIDGFSPTFRHTTFKLQNATCTCRNAAEVAKAEAANGPGAAPKVVYKTTQFDVKSAYLKGVRPEGKQVYVRPPMHAPQSTRFRKKDDRRVNVVWGLHCPLYGEIEAGAHWHKTCMAFCTGGTDTSSKGLAFNQSGLDPCYMHRILSDGTYMDIGLYVDDGWCTHAGTPCALEVLAELNTKFGITQGEGKWFLGCNVETVAGNITIHMGTYVKALAEKYLPKPLDSYPRYEVPATDELREAYAEALTRDHVLTGDAKAKYMSKCGAAIYACPAARVGDCFAIGICARCLTFPTLRMDACLDRIIASMAQDPLQGVTYDGSCSELTTYCDSDWAVSNSTSAQVSTLGGAGIGWASKRQHCKALSSTEAEIMAASLAACEIMYFRGLLAEMGFAQQKPTVLWCDNQGAVALAKHRSSSKRSRHIERRYLHIRELVFDGHIEVRYIPTAENPAELLTKPLSPDGR